MMREMEPGEINPKDQVGAFRLRVKLARAALRRSTTYGDWRMERPSNAEFAQQLLDPVLAPAEIRPFDAQEEEQTIHSTRAYDLIRTWQISEGQPNRQQARRTASARLRAAFQDVVKATLLSPHDMNMVASINRATTMADGPGTSGRNNTPTTSDMDSQMPMIRARRELFDELVAFTQDETI